MDDALVAQINQGLLVLIGVGPSDTGASAKAMADKIANLRIIADSAGQMNLSLLDLGQEVLLVSQFTLLADTTRGRRPSFVNAAKPEQALPLVDAVADALRSLGVACRQGVFGASMDVELINQGPVTLLLEN